ncbi:hypothetical protein KIL84_001065 [Mauremys mutica]|uniref:Uncharacterized protein n=1 Tax=Mauremys mutica TaxID=74926 RepID=A0A9D3WZW4_9SAUR|nr:hypothetical protein KIL84_000481 [Mauremys mutica]KAH1170080.1 hypothetical protein KIL84_001065 [Mauremys mutica]
MTDTHALCFPVLGRTNESSFSPLLKQQIQFILQNFAEAWVFSWVKEASVEEGWVYTGATTKDNSLKSQLPSARVLTSVLKWHRSAFLKHKCMQYIKWNSTDGGETLENDILKNVIVHLLYRIPKCASCLWNKMGFCPKNLSLEF